MTSKPRKDRFTNSFDFERAKAESLYSGVAKPSAKEASECISGDCKVNLGSSGLYKATRVCPVTDCDFRVVNPQALSADTAFDGTCLVSVVGIASAHGSTTKVGNQHKSW